MRGIIVVLEDEYLIRDLNGKMIRKNFPGYRVLLIGTEAEFYAAFDTFLAAPPVLALCGARVKWTDPAPEMPKPPAEVLAGTYRQAGFRCWKMLRDNPQTKGVPVVFYTVIDERYNAPSDVLKDPKTAFVEMSTDGDGRILSAIRRFISARR